MPEPEIAEPDGRRRRAARSRRRIVQAATARFAADGYAATTIGAIARDAGVATQTVYYDFGTKRNVLRAVLDAAIAGDDPSVPVRDQAWVDEVARQTDPAPTQSIPVTNVRRLTGCCNIVNSWRWEN